MYFYSASALCWLSVRGLWMYGVFKECLHAFTPLSQLLQSLSIVKWAWGADRELLLNVSRVFKRYCHVQTVIHLSELTMYALPGCFNSLKCSYCRNKTLMLWEKKKSFFFSLLKLENSVHVNSDIYKKASQKKLQRKQAWSWHQNNELIYAEWFAEKNPIPFISNKNVVN